MLQLFKICHIKNNKIEKIYVFIGVFVTDYNTLFSDDPDNEVFDKIFTKDEKKNIISNSIPVDSEFFISIIVIITYNIVYVNHFLLYQFWLPSGFFVFFCYFIIF